MPMLAISREVATLLAAAIVLSFVGNALSPKGIAWLGDWDTRYGVVSARAKDDVVQRDLEIKDLQSAKAMYDQGDRLFVDARRESDYLGGHIRRAVSFPVNRFESLIGDFWEAHPMETNLVIYYSGRLCEDSHHLAQLLLDAGYQNIRVLIDGFDAWKEAGFPIE